MPRFRLEDAFAFHPKVIQAGNAAIGAWVRMGTYCSANLTDGFVPDRIARLIANEDEIAELARASMLVKVKDGYCIHDYLEYQFSKKEVEEDRASARERMREKRNPVRANISRTSEEVPVGISVSESGSEGEGAGRGKLSGNPGAATKKLVDRWRADAESVLDALNAARKRVNSHSRGLSPTYDSLKHIADRLQAGKSLDDCLHVVAVCEAECRADAGSFKWFDPVSPFRPDNFERKLAADAGIISRPTSEPRPFALEPTRPKPPNFRKPIAVWGGS
jgi:hypothetical protein